MAGTIETDAIITASMSNATYKGAQGEKGDKGDTGTNGIPSFYFKDKNLHLVMESDVVAQRYSLDENGHLHYSLEV